MTAVPDNTLPDSLSDREHRILGEASLALFAGRLVLDAQPPIDDALLDAVAERCAGPLPDPLIALWRTTFGGRLDYNLSADLDGQNVPLSFTELFYPDSNGYHDLWGWIDHEGMLAQETWPDWSGRLVHLPIGGFEYLERVYVHTAAGPDYGAVDCWRQGLPPGWELTTGDRVGRLADDLHALFGQLVLDQNPWETADATGEKMRDAIDELGESGDPTARSAAAKLRRIVQATVLDWRAALDDGTLAAQRRLRQLALERAASDDDVELLARLAAAGCDPAEEIGSGLTPLDVALMHRAFAVVPWLLEHDVPVENSLWLGAHAVDLELARTLLDRGASVDVRVVGQALDNDDVEVVRLLARAVQPDAELARLVPRLRTLAAEAAHAADRLTEESDATAAELKRRRSSALTEVADRFDPGHRS
ncbi:ankyrin repeat domain-containing protein [Actinomadura sp. NAK00032]|uniref:ankyrin repeat domain-containing protein n=1 Tax=Actinomadura sp. NAK00032 TaxID=2742128 RepID=UPI0015914C78|nr:ankyrin repeat domain-containing protein [Actinomadura sp. NAK00032]QKW32827.1 ankyrin repeat domain-containing protein [Actinomadura sp. NAK00032]